MNNFLYKHFELVSAALIVGAVGGLCVYESYTRSQSEPHIVCADGGLSRQSRICVAVSKNSETNNTAYVPVPRRR